MWTKAFVTISLLVTIIATTNAHTVVNITDLGGIPDGQTDTAPAFRHAMKTIAQAGGGRIVFPPAPRPYLVTETLIINVSHVEIWGEGATLLLADGASKTIIEEQRIPMI